MTKCTVYIDESNQEYEGQYQREEGELIVEIFDYNTPNEEEVEIGEYVKYKKIVVEDLQFLSQ